MFLIGAKNNPSKLLSRKKGSLESLSNEKSGGGESEPEFGAGQLRSFSFIA